MQKVIFKKLPVCEPSKFMKITKNKKPTNTNHKKIICKSAIETIFPWLIKSHVKAGNTSGHAGRGGDGFQ